MLSSVRVCTIRMCLLRSVDALNAFVQITHLCSLWLVWVTSCRLKLLQSVNCRWHTSQVYSVLRVWVLMCLARILVVIKYGIREAAHEYDCNCLFSEVPYQYKSYGTHQSLVGLAPAYLADDCRLLSGVGRRPLRSNSNDMRKLLVSRTHNKLGNRSFSAAGPRLWNDLPPGLRRPGLTLDSFRQSLKTHLFGDRSA